MSRPTRMILENHQTAPFYANSNSQGVKTNYYPGDEVCQGLSVNGETTIFSREGAPLLATYGFKEQCLQLKPFQVDDEYYRLLPLNSKSDCSKIIINPTDVSSSLDNLMDVRYLKGPSRKFVRRIKSIQRGYIDNKYRFRAFDDIRSFTFNNRADIWNHDDQTYRRALDTWIKLTTGTSHGYHESEEGQTTEYNRWHYGGSKDFLEDYADFLEENEREAGQIGQIGKVGREASANDDVQSTIDRVIETHGTAMPGLPDPTTRHGVQATVQMGGTQTYSMIGGASRSPQGNGHGYGYEHGSFGDTQGYSASNQSGNNPYHVTSAHGSLPEYNQCFRYQMQHQPGGSWLPHGSYSAQTVTPQMGEQGHHEDSMEENHVTRSINEMLDRFS